MRGLDPLMCRACLVTDVKLFNLHQIGLADLFGYLSKTAVAPSDGLPQYVCFYCRTQLCKLRDFQYKCQKSLIYFKENALQVPSGFSTPLTKTRCLFIYYIPENIIANDNLIYKIEERSPNGNFNNSNNLMNVKIELDPIDDENRKTDETSLSCDEQNNGTLEGNVKSENIDEIGIIAEPFKELKRLDFIDGDDRKTNVFFLSCDNYDEENNETLDQKVNVKSKIIDGTNTAEPLKEFKKDEDVLKDTKNLEDCLIGKSRKTKKKTAKTKQTAAKKPKKKCNRYNEKFEEDFKEFSKIHNVKVVCLSKDEQIRRVQERKESKEYRNSRFSCDVCYKGFMSENAHKRHMKSHDPNSGAYVCEVCQMRYQTKRQLIIHARKHKKIFVCALCDQVNINAARAKLHWRWHKGIKFPCKTCHKEFKAHTTYLNHVREVHKPVSCAHCGQTLLGTHALQAHVSTHNQDAQSTSGGVSTCELDAQSTSGGVSTNELDAQSTSGGVSTNELDGQSTSGGVFTCELCDAVFSSDRGLCKHYAKAHKKSIKDKSPTEYLCDQCAKSFPGPAQLKVHLQIHTGEKPFRCPMCPKSFRFKAMLKVHINVHTGDRPYKCPQCPETFKSYAQRYKHKLMVHLNQRRYKCSICDKSYVVAFDLKEHIRFVHLNQPRPPRRNRRRKQCGDNLAK